MKGHELDQTIKCYILSCIEEDCEGQPLETTQAKIEYLRDRFNSEYGFRVQQVGRRRACTEWLQGLALNLEFMNYKILELATQWGSLPAEPTERQEEKIPRNYWEIMANKTLQLIDGYRVPKED